MPPSIRRLYADTSVFGGAFDTEFVAPTQRLLAQIRSGRFELVTSVVVQDEVSRGPEEVRGLFASLADPQAVIEPSDEALRLAGAYVEAGVITEKWRADGLHVAVATLAGCIAVVSWNFRHIVHVEKAKGYNAVNMAQGCAQIAICSPPEVIEYGPEEEGF
jgi:predicted nucleic acid-binding protein